MTAGLTKRAMHNELRATKRLAEASLAEPNKPVLPTAHTSLNEHPLHPLRRHIGQPSASKSDEAAGCTTSVPRGLELLFR
jgi:hypothetical protein